MVGGEPHALSLGYCKEAAHTCWGYHLDDIWALSPFESGAEGQRGLEMPGTLLPPSHLPSGLSQTFLAALLILKQNSSEMCIPSSSKGLLLLSLTCPEYHLEGDSLAEICVTKRNQHMKIWRHGVPGRNANGKYWRWG